MLPLIEDLFSMKRATETILANLSKIGPLKTEFLIANPDEKAQSESLKIVLITILRSDHLKYFGVPFGLLIRETCQVKKETS